MMKLSILLMVIFASCRIGEPIMDLDDCKNAFSETAIIGVWEFAHRGTENKFFDTSNYSQTIKYEYLVDNKYKFYNKKLLSEKTFDGLPLGEWVEMESGQWGLNSEANSIEHTNKQFTVYSNRRNENHVYRIKWLCDDYLIAYAYTEPQGKSQARMLNYMQRVK